MTTVDGLVYRMGGKVAAQATFDATFYITRLAGNERALIRAYECVIAWLGPSIRWYRTERMTQPAPITPAALQAFPTWFSQPLAGRREYGLQLTAGSTREELGGCGLQFFLAPAALEREAGYFQFYCPAALGQDNPERLVSIVRSVADLLAFRSGHAGYGVQYDESAGLEHRDTQIRAWCNRYHGLDGNDLATIREHVVSSIKGVNWITLIDSEFCDRLGGPKVLRSNLPAPIAFTELRSGYLIRAGAAPGLGDRNRREELQAYRQVSDALKAVRMDGGWATGWFDREEALEWTRRWDRS
jgi:hypothetical protein